MARPDLDAWLPEPVLRTVHRREADVGERALWAAAGEVALQDSRMLGRLVRWRIPGVPAGITYRELFRREPFIVLDEGEAHSLSGLAGRIWTLRRDYPQLEGPAAFRQFAEPGMARVLFAHWVEPAARGRVALVSEVRVAVDGARARSGLRLVRPLIGSFQNLIGSEALALAVRRAECAARAPRN